MGGTEQGESAFLGSDSPENSGRALHPVIAEQVIELWSQHGFYGIAEIFGTVDRGYSDRFSWNSDWFSEHSGKRDLIALPPITP